jgi:DNA-binding NtrC family response regulator
MEGYGKRVLIVEDERLALDMLAEMFSQAGYNVHTAGDGQAALAEMNRRHFDAIVTDYHMPRLNGMELLAVTRMVCPDIPVVLVSGDQVDLSETAIRQGAYAWLQKPYEPSALLEIVAHAIHASGRPRERHTPFSTAG